MIAAIQSTRPPDYFLPVVSDLLLVVAAWTLLPNRFVLQALTAAIATGASVTLDRRVPGPARPLPTVLLLLGNALLATNLAGGYVSWRLHRARRLQFLAGREQESLDRAACAPARSACNRSSTPAPTVTGSGTS